MVTWRPRIESASLSSARTADRKDREQMRRLLSEPQKPAPAPAVGGAMQGFTRAQPGSPMWGPGGVQMGGWTFDTSLDASPFSKPKLIADDGPFIGVNDAGHYVTHVRAQFTIASGTATMALVQANTGFAGTDLVSYYGEMWAMKSPMDGRFRADFWVGPFWLPEGATAIGIDVAIPGPFIAGSVSSTFIDVWRVS